MPEEKATEQADAPAAAPRQAAAPMFSGAGIGVMLVVMALEAAVVFYIARWWAGADSGGGHAPTLDEEVVTVDLGTIPATYQSERGPRTHRFGVILRVNPKLDDPTATAAALTNHKKRLESLIQQLMISKGDALADPGISTRLQSEIRGLVNETYPAEGEGVGLISEVWLTVQ